MIHKAVIMEVADFVDTFIPLPPSLSLEDRPEWSSDIFTNLAEGTTSQRATLPDWYFAAINNGNILPGFEMAQLTDKPEIDDIDDFGQKVNAAFCREDNLPIDSQLRWVDQLISIEFKRYKANTDPFYDCEDYICNDTVEECRKTHEQIIMYMGPTLDIPLHAVHLRAQLPSPSLGPIRHNFDAYCRLCC
ncbi:hypothetical protein NUW54_g1021 [Trametes sanguinea]|uniref:Uncharacterized protein n=1 Tax=Trametes sanguinea TaxID=158606 RepID=A0ACC1QAP3_9APHY|nr:hypothetical protein NUW54_g1021 [Trametes sanguinea]